MNLLRRAGGSGRSRCGRVSLADSLAGPLPIPGKSIGATGFEPATSCCQSSRFADLQTPGRCWDLSPKGSLTLSLTVPLLGSRCPSLPVCGAESPPKSLPCLVRVTGKRFSGQVSPTASPRRDAALAVYRNLVTGRPIEPVIASLRAAQSDDDSQDPSRLDAGLINWPALVEAFRFRCSADGGRNSGAGGGDS
jgi:hypothetical protein